MRPMTKHACWALGLALSLMLGATHATAAAPESQAHLAVAMFSFQTEDPELTETAAQLSELAAAELSSTPELILVEREHLDAALGELELGLSGTIQPGTAARIGQLVGAKALITCRLFFLGEELTATARVIGTETSRVFVESVSIPSGAPISQLAKDLGERLAASLTRRRGELVGPPAVRDDRIERLAQLTTGKSLPTVSIDIEERHAGRPTLDPAAQTELALIFKRLGFRLIEPAAPHARAEVRITGEAISEEGLHKGNLVSASGRVEIQAVDAESREVIAVDRRTEVAVDLSGQIAGKKALERASAEVSEALIVALLNR